MLIWLVGCRCQLWNASKPSIRNLIFLLVARGMSFSLWLTLGLRPKCICMSTQRAHAYYCAYYVFVFVSYAAVCIFRIQTIHVRTHILSCWAQHKRMNRCLILLFRVWIVVVDGSVTFCPSALRCFPKCSATETLTQIYILLEPNVYVYVCANYCPIRF